MSASMPESVEKLGVPATGSRLKAKPSLAPKQL